MKTPLKAKVIPQNLRPVPPPPAPAPLAPGQHPLDLNENESRWQHHCVGPIDGWFSFGEHGNPPFDTPVQVVRLAHAHNDKECVPVNVVGVGIRTRSIDDGCGKERWLVYSQFSERGNKITHWRFLSAPPKKPSP